MSNAGWYSEGFEQSLNVCVAANEDGRLEVFTYESVGAGRVWHKWQLAPNNGWSSWAPFDPVVDEYTYNNEWLSGHTDLFAGLTGNGDSRLQAVTQGDWIVAQTNKNNGWGGWGRIQSNGMPDSLLLTTLARSIDGRLYAFGVDQRPLDVLFSEQDAVGGNWGSWQNFGHPTDHDAFYAVRVDDWGFRSGFPRAPGQNQAVGANQDGRLEIFGASRLQMWHMWQTDLNDQNKWLTWQPLGMPPSGIENLRDWVVIQNQDGRLEVFAASTDSHFWHTWQATPNGGWEPWALLPGLEVTFWPKQVPENPVKGTFRAARDSDGCIELFAVGREGGVFILKQRRPNGGWPDAWEALGGEQITALDVGQNQDGRLEVFIVSGGSVWHRWQMESGRDGQWSTHEA